jgi:hypothetical protein
MPLPFEPRALSRRPECGRSASDPEIREQLALALQALAEAALRGPDQ